MSEQDTTVEAPEGAEVEQEMPEPDTDAAPEATEDDGPDWRKDFDPDRAAERIRKIQSENKNLRNRAKEAEEKAKGADTLTKENGSLAAENLRLTIGYELGLPLALAKRLNGSTRDELLADADELVKIAGAGRPSTTRKPVEALRGGGEPEAEPEERDLDKLAGRMFRR